LKEVIDSQEVGNTIMTQLFRKKRKMIIIKLTMEKQNQKRLVEYLPNPKVKKREKSEQL
jgi:hypothetical protein